MAEAREGLADALADVDLRAPKFPIVANASASPVTEAANARELLIEQLTSPVRWVECVQTMRAENPALWLEIGPGKVLSGLMRRIGRDQKTRAIGGPEDLDNIDDMLEEDEGA
jgi:[acyl-carrier-protein] S-malonyltransferase